MSEIAKTNAAQTANTDGRNSASLIELTNRVADLERRLLATGNEPPNQESIASALWPPLTEPGNVAGAIDRFADMIALRLHYVIAALSVNHSGDLEAINNVRSYFGNETL